MKYYAQDVAGDGNCLFASVLAAWLERTGMRIEARETHALAVTLLRELCVRHMVCSNQTDEVLVCLCEGVPGTEERIGAMRAEPLQWSARRRVGGTPVRRLIVSAAEEEPTQEEEEEEEGGGEQRSVEQYIRTMRREGAWGGASEVHLSLIHI